MLKFTTIKIILAVTIFSFTHIAHSKDISYDYLQGSYTSTTIDLGDGSDLDGDEFGVSGSFSISDNFALNAAYNSTSLDPLFGVEIDFTSLAFGILAHTQISPATDVFGGIAFINSEIEISDSTSSGSGDDTGNILSVGIRSMMSDNLELNVSITRTDIFDDAENAFTFGARFYANEKLSLGAAYLIADDIDSLIFSVRIDL